MKHFYLLLLLFTIGTAFGQQNPENSDIEGFKIYPNPVTTGTVYIVTAANKPKKIRIFDVLGTPVLETTIMGRELNLSGIKAGVYLIQVYENNKVATRKLVVK
jgi:hypothetical protein